MRLIGQLISFAVLLLSQTPTFGSIDDAYLAELIAKSRQLRLAEKPEWLKLVHYVPNLISPGVHGMVDGPEFYNAPDGKSNPQSELEATLASFYSDTEESDKQQNPQCLFLARYVWLDEQLAFDPQRLPRRVCKRYQQWYGGLNPSGLTLIFASAYLNNPSSMYGHPLLRVDAKDQDDHTRLLAYAITFAANTNEADGIAFVVKGLFGGYPGVFSIMPYYLKVREYSNLENRDLWEYQMNLNPKEVDRVLRHTWELGSTWYQYFFFDENCAYHLLGLLQVARPELDLTGQFRWWLIPTDSVRSITGQKDMVKKVVYRPSNATVLGHRMKGLSEQERRLARDLSMKRISVGDPVLRMLPVNREAAVLETSQDYVSYRRALGKNDVADPAGLAHELLAARSRLDAVAQTPEIPVPEVHPDQGHGSSRIDFGTGRKGDQSFQELRARATYHDIMDAEGGYARGAQTEFFSLAFRHYDSGNTQDSGSTRVEKFTPINILSLTPRDDFFESMSWNLSAGWQRVRAARGSEPLAFALDGGAGGSWSNGNSTALWYTLLDGSSRFNSDLVKGYALGAGASIGGLFDPGPRWRVHGYARGMRYFLGQRDLPLTLGLEQRVSLGRNLALRLDIARNRELERTYNSGLMSMLFYF
ncbi:MAG: DUF4105 domain-containing protein [Gallionella sp.]|nr:DUF4105 domain-containing protein [Gallionella sp.]